MAAARPVYRADDPAQIFPFRSIGEIAAKVVLATAEKVAK